jgi:hypothetical protein
MKGSAKREQHGIEPPLMGVVGVVGAGSGACGSEISIRNPRREHPGSLPPG